MRSGSLANTGLIGARPFPLGWTFIFFAGGFVGFASLTKPFNSSELMRLRKMGVANNHLQGLVAEKLLQGPQVHAGHYATARKRMPQVVPVKVHQTRLLDHRIPPIARILKGTDPVGADENSSLSGRLTAHSLKRMESGLVQGNVPDGPILGLPEGYSPRDQIHVLPAQAVLLTSSHARVEYDVELRHVLWILSFDSRAQLLFLILREEADALIVLAKSPNHASRILLAFSILNA